MTSKLSDLPKMRRIASARLLAKSFIGLSRVLQPVAQVIGRSKTIDNLVDAASEIVEFSPGLETLPDRFVTQFGSRGWIMYEMLNVDVVRACVEKAEAGDVDGAEADLIAHFTPEILDMQLMWLTNGVRAFRPRAKLARKALEDHKAGRYYASVLVTLSLLDGLVNDLHESRKALSAAGVRLEAWDSISAHAAAFGRLARLIHTPRTRTSDEPLTVPYRHGIMHGRDLDYDNRAVSTKAWAALFAARDWSMKVEERATGQPPPGKTLWATLRHHAEWRRRADAQERLYNEWVNRTVHIGTNCPAHGAPEHFSKGTPEHRIAEFAFFLHRKNYGKIAECFVPRVGPEITIKRLAREYRRQFEATNLTDYTIRAVEDLGAAGACINVEFCGDNAGSPFCVRETVRLLYKSDSGELLPRQTGEGAWRLVMMPAIPHQHPGTDLDQDE